MLTESAQKNPKSRNKILKHRIIGKKIIKNKLVISDSNIESNTDFFEDIPLYRDSQIKPVRRLGKIHLHRSRKTKSTKT